MNLHVLSIRNVMVYGRNQILILLKCKNKVNGTELTTFTFCVLRALHRISVLRSPKFLSTERRVEAGNSLS